jgi:hypothetical protein
MTLITLASLSAEHQFWCTSWTLARIKMGIVVSKSNQAMEFALNRPRADDSYPIATLELSACEL